MKSFGVRASVAFIVAAALVLGGAATSASAAPQDDVVSLTNQQRYSAGLPALTRDATLDAAAQEWAQNMSNTRNMEHSSNAWRAARIPAGWYTNGENIAYGYGSAGSVMTGWMNSPGHKENILRSNFTHIGVGYVASGNYWVQIFAGYDKAKAPKRPPVGNLEGGSISVASGQPVFSFGGWAFDPSSPTAQIPVHLYVTDPSDTTRGMAVNASENRPDIAAVYPNAGAAHGFSASVPVTRAGDYRVCGYALGTSGINTYLGCRIVGWGPGKPFGSVDVRSITLQNGTPTLSVSGWAMDDSLRSVSTQVHIYVTDPSDKTTGIAVDANAARSDIASVFPGAGPAHGFSYTSAASLPGIYRACVYAIGASAFGSTNKPLGCKEFSLGSSAPIGNFEAASNVRPGVIAMSGWSFDRGLPSLSTDVHLYVTGPDDVTKGSSVKADLGRWDIGNVYRQAGEMHGFAAEAAAPNPGVYRLCAYSISSPLLRAAHASLGCRYVTVPR